MRYSSRIEYRLSGLMTCLLIAIGLALTLSTSPTRAERGRNAHQTRRSDLSPRPKLAAAPVLVAPVVNVFTVNTTNDTHALLPAVSALDGSGNTSLRSATEAADAQGGTAIINVPPGTYNLSISPFELQVGSDPNEDISIFGTGNPSNTIIHQTVANNRVFDLDFNFAGSVVVSISNVTISGGVGDLFGGGGIVAGDPGDVLTVSNCVITGNSTTATNNGGGISFSGGGDLIIQNNSVISNNTATQGVGGGIFFDNGTNPGNLTITNSTVSGNTATAGAGAGQGGGLFASAFTGSTTTIARSVFGNNSAQTPIGQGGAIYVSGGAAGVNFSRVFGNTAASGSGIFKSTSAGPVDANDNWWGCNSGPGSSGGCSGPVNGVQNVLVTNWLQLRASASPNSICTGASSTITADIFGQNSGGPTDPANLVGLPAFPVPAAAIFGNAVLGTLSGASMQFVDGMATATFTAGSIGGAGSADATADNQTVTASLTINENTTSALTNQVVCAGGTATFSTTASGPGPFSFVWKKGATVLNNGDLGGRVTITNGANTSSLSISNVQSGDADTYSVAATGSCGTATQSATLTVNAATSATTPADQTVCQGTNASFSTTASGTGPFHYAWTVDGSAFDGDNSSISVPTGSLSVGNHPVSVTVTGACGSDTKNATLTVQTGTTTTDPPDQTVCQGASAGFATTAGGTGPFHYAWTLDGSPFNGDNASISVPTGSLSVGNHTVAVNTTGACGSASQSATLTVQASTATSDPADQTVCQGASAGFSTTASGTGPFHYAWTLDGSSFNGDNASISVDTTSLSVGNHTVAVTTTGTCGSASQSATLTVQANTATSDPPDQTVCSGTNASFSTTASGTGPFHYAWTLDGSPFNGDNPSISVPTGSLSVGNHTVAVTTTGTCGSASQSATLTVQPGTTTSDPADQTVCPGTNANFSTTASGTGPFHYAWTLDGSPFNGDNPSISVPTGSLSVGNHSVAVTTTGTCGSASQSATLTVQPGTTTSVPPDQTVCPGTNANFSTTAGGTGPFHYAWTLDGSPFNGDNPSISVPTGSLSVGNHTVAVTTTGSCGSASQTATLIVRQNTSTTDPADQNVCEGGTAVFSTTASGTGPFSFVWKQGATVINNGDRGGRVTIVNGSSSSMLTITNVQATDFGTYNIETTGSCNTATQSATLAVNNTPPSITLNGQNIELWPPNHSYHTITVANLVASASSCDGTVNINSVIIDHVTSDEAENGNGSGNTINDIVIGCDRKSVQLRAERDGGGDGRVYTIYFKVTDGLGHSTTVTAKVIVPHSQNGDGAVDSGPHYTVSSATCP